MSERGAEIGEVAVRHPGRGKTHRYVEQTSWERERSWPHTTPCGAPMRKLTEQLPYDSTTAEERCKKCFPVGFVPSKTGNLRVTLFGEVHRRGCGMVPGMTWEWDGVNNLSADRHCPACLPDGLPVSPESRAT